MDGIDAGLWAVLAFAIGWVLLGCFMTAPKNGLVNVKRRAAGH